MVIYISFVCLSILFFSFSYYQIDEKENALGVSYREPRPILFGMGCLVLILLFAFRGRTGTDTPLYNRVFNKVGSMSLKEVITIGRDQLFYILNWLTYRLSSGNLLFHNIVVGCLEYIPILNVYKKYSKNCVLSVLFYIITSSYFFAFNGQRQGLAISITFAGFSFLANKKYWSYLILVLFASLFHSSALIILPFGFLSTYKTDSKLFIIVSAGLLLSTFFLWRLWDTIFYILDLLGRDKIVDGYSSLSEETAAGTGVNTLRVLVYVLPTLLGILHYEQLQENNRYFYVILNLNIISSLLMIAATKTWYIARFSDYFYVAMPFLLVELQSIVKENSKILFTFMIIILFLVYIWFSLHMESHLLPYYLTINNFVKVFP